MTNRDVYIDERVTAEAAERRKSRKPAEQGWFDYIGGKLDPILEGIKTAGGQGARAFGPLKEPIDTAFDYIGSQGSRTIGMDGFSEPKMTPEQIKARREERAAADPASADLGYRTTGLLRDAALTAAGPLGKIAKTAGALYNMRYGSTTGAASQGLDEYDRAVNRNLPVEPSEVGERLIAASVGGAGGAMLTGAGARRTPLARDMSPIPGKPLTAAELTATAKAHQTAAQHGDTAPDLAMLMRATEDPALMRRSADVESMYRKSKPLVIDESEISKHGPPEANRLSGRLSTPLKDGHATVAPEVLDQLRTRSAPGGFTARVDQLAQDLAHRERILARRADHQNVPIEPAPGAMPQGILNKRKNIYDQTVEEARAPTADRPGYLTEPDAKLAVGDPGKLDFWNKTLATLSPQERRVAEDALASITRAATPRKGAPIPASGTGPQGIGGAFADRARAQRALDDNASIQRAIGESFPYKPGEPPKLTIAPPAFAPARIGLEIPGMGQGAASRGTTKAFKDPTAAAADIGRKSQAELWAMFLGAQTGMGLTPMAWENLRGHAR